MKLKDIMPQSEETKSKFPLIKELNDLANSKKTAWGFLRDLHSVCHFQTREGKKVGRASTSELKRWIQNKALIINGETVDVDEVIDFPIISVVLFPKNPITFW